MSNPDRLQREAQEHALALIEDRGLFNALAWAIHCANRSTDGFWSRVVQAIEAIRDAEDTSLDGLQTLPEGEERNREKGAG